MGHIHNIIIIIIKLLYTCIVLPVVTIMKAQLGALSKLEALPQLESQEKQFFDEQESYYNI